MSSIMRARSGLMRRSERLESIGVPLWSRRLLDLQCSGPDAPIVTPYRSPPRRLRTGGDARPSRESGFVHGGKADVVAVDKPTGLVSYCSGAAHRIKDRETS